MSTFVNPILTFINRCSITVFSKQEGVNSKPCMTRFPHIAAALCGFLFLLSCVNPISSPFEDESSPSRSLSDTAFCDTLGFTISVNDFEDDGTIVGHVKSSSHTHPQTAADHE